MNISPRDDVRAPPVGQTCEVIVKHDETSILLEYNNNYLFFFTELWIWHSVNLAFFLKNTSQNNLTD